MLFLIFLVLIIAGAVFLGILWNKRVLKDYPNDKGTHQIISMALFIVAAIIIYSVIFAGISVNKLIKDKSQELIVYIEKDDRIPQYIKDGLDMTMVSENLGEINKFVADLQETMWPHARDLGVPRYFYDWAAKRVTIQIQIRLVGLNAAERAALIFVDNNNYITYKSLLGTLRSIVMKGINIAIMVIVIIVLLVVGIFVLVTFNTISKEKKKLAAEAGPALA